jgi:hypothetical protein
MMMAVYFDKTPPHAEQSVQNGVFYSVVKRHYCNIHKTS